MPIYEFECRHCGKVFEKLMTKSQKKEEVLCPHCGTPRPDEKISTWASIFGKAAGNCAPGGG